MRVSLKTPLVAFALCLVVTPAWAGLMEFLSSTANTINTLSVCPQIPDDAVKVGLALAERCPPDGPSSCLNAQAADLKKIADRVRQDSEDRIFDLLAAQHSRELACGATFAQAVAVPESSGAALVGDIEGKLQVLRVLRHQNTRASDEIMHNPNILQKFCPLTMDDLQPSPYANGVDLFYQNCKSIIQSRTGYFAVLATIPLSNVPAIKDFLDKYANEPDSELPANEAALQQSIRAAYAAGANNLTQESKRLKTLVATDGPSPFNRQERYALLSDPRVNKAVVDSGGDGRLKGLLCQADADYHQGADNLSTDLFIGGMMLSGTTITMIKAGEAALGLFQGLEAAEAAGQITMSGAKVLQISAYWVINGIGIYNNIDRACNPGGEQLIASSEGGMCVSAPSVEQLPQNNCVLGIAMQLIGFASKTGDEVVDLVEKLNITNPAALKLIELFRKLPGKAAAISH